MLFRATCGCVGLAVGSCSTDCGAEATIRCAELWTQLVASWLGRPCYLGTGSMYMYNAMWCGMMVAGWPVQHNTCVPQGIKLTPACGRSLYIGTYVHIYLSEHVCKRAPLKKGEHILRVFTHCPQALSEWLSYLTTKSFKRTIKEKKIV